MFIIICYDITDDRRRNRVMKLLEGHGERVQKSVFECWLDIPRLNILKGKLARTIDEDVDQLRYYRLCGKDACNVLIDGRGDIPRDTLAYIV